MPFSNFITTEDVQRLYGITAVDRAFVGNSGLMPSSEFHTLFEFDMTHVDVRDEAARRETVIYPILREAFRHHTDQLSLFSHRMLASEEPLSGIADYFVAKRSALGRNVLEQPILVIAEAKRDDFEQGWAQCLAEMIAAQRSTTMTPYPFMASSRTAMSGRLVFCLGKNGCVNRALTP